MGLPPAMLEILGMDDPAFLRLLAAGGMGATGAGGSLADELATAKKYDPNASIVTHGGDDGTQSWQQVQYDPSKLPQPKVGQQYDLQSDISHGLLGSGYSPSGATGQVRTSTAGEQLDPNAGYTADSSDWRNVTDKENNAAQDSSQDFLGKTMGSLVPSDHPWAVIPEAIGAGIAGSGALNGLAKGAANLGIGAAESGGKSLTDPFSYLGLAGGMLPPEVAKYIGYAGNAANAIKNPVGTATNLAGGAAGTWLANILKGS